jgi:hypothetical protein
VVVHARRETYRAAVGRGSDQTFGSSLIRNERGTVQERRVDLLIDSHGKLSALGHELTHVVIADAFPGGPPPAWANEGVAVLADSASKRQLHERDLEDCLRRRTSFHCAELMQLAGYPPPHRIAAFYGQSASLIAFLSSIGDSGKLIPFIKEAAASGYDPALRKHYGIENVAELQARWLQSRWAGMPAQL